jgi:hypothetical protein
MRLAETLALDARMAEVLVLITFIVQTPEWSGRTNWPVAAGP